jgi:hypothetical protein
MGVRSSEMGDWETGGQGQGEGEFINPKSCLLRTPYFLLPSPISHLPSPISQPNSAKIKVTKLLLKLYRSCAHRF